MDIYGPMVRANCTNSVDSGRHRTLWKLCLTGFTPDEEGEYRLIQRYLTELEAHENISWVSYSLPAEPDLKVAIRGIPVDTTPEDIIAGLCVLSAFAEAARDVSSSRRSGAHRISSLQSTTWKNFSACPVSPWRRGVAGRAPHHPSGTHCTNATGPSPA
ncbi:unnamed protein product [Pieris macdunnoughi]|uniref:Uncharacterized protein n=1 Tax=Pieris macdunnoughi TaxID=345717 RepID=A0A821XPQ5_9NEOP|nr:unnamed protein product [Pieris macdunnoughi]